MKWCFGLELCSHPPQPSPTRGDDGRGERHERNGALQTCLLFLEDRRRGVEVWCLALGRDTSLAAVCFSQVAQLLRTTEGEGRAKTERGCCFCLGIQKRREHRRCGVHDGAGKAQVTFPRRHHPPAKRLACSRHPDHHNSSTSPWSLGSRLGNTLPPSHGAVLPHDSPLCLRLVPGAFVPLKAGARARRMIH